MTGMILDAVLMLMLVCAVAYGVRLEKKLVALRQGQLAFAQAVTELNQAASRAEQALANLRASGQETDLLHDRIIKAREVKAQLETLIARGGDRLATPARAEPRVDLEERRPAPQPLIPPARPVAQNDAEDERALRMAALARRIQEMGAPSGSTQQGRGDVSAILGALAAARDSGRGESANPVQKPVVNPGRARMDDDLFAA